MCVPGGGASGDQHEEIPTLSARIEEKQKRSQAENASCNIKRWKLFKLVIDNFLTSYDGLWFDHTQETLKFIKFCLSRQMSECTKQIFSQDKSHGTPDYPLQSKLIQFLQFLANPSPEFKPSPERGLGLGVWTVDYRLWLNINTILWSWHLQSQ